MLWRLHFCEGVIYGGGGGVYNHWTGLVDSGFPLYWNVEYAGITGFDHSLHAHNEV